MSKTLRLLVGAALAGAVLFQVSVAQAQGGAIEQLEKGVVNWSEGYVEASGAGAPSPNAPNPATSRLWAERAARADAYRNLIETVNGVRVDSETVVENYVTASDTVRTRVEGIVRGAKATNKKYLDDGSVEITLRMPLMGDLTRVMLEQVRGEVPKAGSRIENFSMSPAGGSYQDVLEQLQRQREEEARRRAEADRQLRELEIQRKAAEKARKDAERQKQLEELEAQKKELQRQREQAEAEKRRLDELIAEQEAQKTQVASLPVDEPSKAAMADIQDAPKPPSRGSSTAPAAVASDISGGATMVTAMNISMKPVEASSKEEWTGLIVDARSLGLRPSLVPKLITEDGVVVYGAQSVDFDDAVKQGLVGYARDVDAATRHLRVTDDPILIKGVKSYGAKNSDVIVHGGDAEIVHKTAERSGYLKKARVMIVYN